MKFTNGCCAFSLIFLLGCAPFVSNGQPTKGDTVLYLYFDSLKFKKTSNSIGIDTETLKENPESRYAFLTGYHLYDGYPLSFVSIHKEKAVKIVDLRNYDVITPETLKNFIVKNYEKQFIGYSGRSYFDNLRSIYMVEKSTDKTGYTITKVKIDIDIE